ncbi:Peptidase S10, serine carboxypeptidase [Cordyceps fumosorosea ARSEF 2679]|uniref:Carboxypeptidase n=1 Tax=Cordyceps fumosorosea (strain ARSEF 2679) TaxID=1081104 RepID=A0A162JAM2_CORFA|nr:Peptidase S10, serine carboxypeptidase [Cordyceps fumosorosea ARSEF 2679]OAA66152.1 Peptidase S10, serine carboxypeptidase [Cordyceps fumosorosea ARSEF 2679]
MKNKIILAGLFGLAGLVSAGSGSGFLRRHMPESQTTTHQMSRRYMTEARKQKHIDDVPPPRFRNNDTERFYVDGSTLPLIDWNVGESYAGNLPISDSANETSELFFWYFPTATKEFAENKEIVIWLNGGPGCSSLLGFLEENGPIAWGEGMATPQRNPFSFHMLTNVVWLEQPVGVGFTKGHEVIHNEEDIAAQFIGFWKNFARTFSMDGWKVYITGESYAGMYGPYLAQAMLDRADATYYDMAGLLVYNGISWGEALQSAPVAFPFLDMHYDLMPLDQPVFEQLRALDAKCGFEDFRREYFVYPPRGPMPSPLSHADNESDCAGIFDKVNMEAVKKNPCFNIYNIVDRCPRRNEPLSGNDAWFARQDVQAAIHVGPYVAWHECSQVFPEGVEDQSDPAGVHALPQVIDRTGNVIVAAGTNDYILSMNGILLGIQNMTWGGKLGFQQAPSDPFYVPAYGFDPDRMGDDDYNAEFYGYELPAGYGVMGTTHQERGLSFVVSQLAGHEGPEFTPAASFRILEKLLGRIDSLREVSAFSLPQISNVTQPEGELGNGTVKIPCWTRGC